MQHRELAQGGWQRLSFIEQMANIGSEVERAISWKKKNADYAQLAFDRSLELIDLTISDSKNIYRLKEIIRIREALTDFFIFDNIYNTSDKFWCDYFLAFTYAARIDK